MTNVTLQDYALHIAMGPFGSSIKKSTFVDHGIPIISGQHLHRAKLAEDSGFNFITREHADRHPNSIVRRGDVVFTAYGTIGQVSLVPHNSYYDEYIASQRQFFLRPDPEKLDGKYLTYFFHSPFGRHLLLSNSSQVGVPSIASPTSFLRGLTFPIPSLKQQKSIAHTLGTLDDKIELNQKINQTLEEIAKAIFKSWFVDFDPVRAKAEGRPTGLPPEISDLFPDELVDSEIGEIPKGWDVKPADALFDMSIGRTPPRKETQWFSTSETDVPWVSIRDMGDCGTFIGRTSEYLTHDAVSKHRMRKLPTGSVLLSFKLTVGRVSVTTKELTTNEAIAHFPPSNVFPYTNYTYFYLNGFRYESLGSTSSIATAMNSKMVKAIPFIVATPDLLEKFEVTVALMMDRIRLASEEMHILSELRDTLIPKLISGELRIPDAEKFLEEAGI